MYAPIPMVPGPVTVPASIREALARDYPSGQIDGDYFALLRSTERLLASLMGTSNQIVLMTGEGMLALWAGLKSVLTPANRVMVVSTGVFGDGIADMARGLGCSVETYALGCDRTIGEKDLEALVEMAKRHQPHLLCAVHCETPSGTLNPLELLGRIKEDCHIPLFYADVVSSLGGTRVAVDDWHIDLALGGSQKCLSLPPTLSFVSVSQRAWERIREVNYQGYDALLPFATIYEDGRCPYTPSWHGLAALYASLRDLDNEGFEAVFRRHEEVAKVCRTGLKALDIALWPQQDALLSPTVTAARIPAPYTWPEWQQALRKRGLVVAGSFGVMQGKVFRLGHMGSQAQLSLVRSALACMDEVLGRRRMV